MTDNLTLTSAEYQLIQLLRHRKPADPFYSLRQQKRTMPEEFWGNWSKWERDLPGVNTTVDLIVKKQVQELYDHILGFEKIMVWMADNQNEARDRHTQELSLVKKERSLWRKRASFMIDLCNEFEFLFEEDATEWGIEEIDAQIEEMNSLRNHANGT